MKLLKSYKELGHDEFMSKWKQGISNVSPLSQAKTVMFGNIIIIVGVIIGIVTSIIYKQWWLLIILCGSIFVTSVSLLGSYQKVIMLSNLEEMMKGGAKDGS